MASVNMEKEGLLKQLEFFKEKGIKIRSLVTDRHPATRKHMETHEPGIDHFFDIWHISKSFPDTTLNFRCEKEADSSKQTGWMPRPANLDPDGYNHMYWSARAAGGDKKLLIDIWLSMHNHVINKHSGHEGTYGRCLHGDMPEPTRPWMDPKYVGKLIKEAIESSKQWRSLAAASKANTVVFPAPMTAAYTRPPKEELVAARMSRFGQSPQ
ncbi:hypothetical protein HPB47_018486 [Ixodes persulcatus]|uniref:Uncharacterized protein n=1 Tax=Ixodes persulcatus TaxID=34615 RepID=A0AC60QMK1_IXOPE|nr:hypothetical protein HPB47_018486 [Ixodes persulcatus]